MGYVNKDNATFCIVSFLMTVLPQRVTPTYTLLPYSSLCRSYGFDEAARTPRTLHPAHVQRHRLRRPPAWNEHLRRADGAERPRDVVGAPQRKYRDPDRKSTRLNSSHQCASRMPSSAYKTKRIQLYKQNTCKYHTAPTTY